MSSGQTPSSPTASGPSTTAAGNTSSGTPASSPTVSTSPGTQTSGGTPPQQPSGIQSVSLPGSFHFIAGDPLYTVQTVTDPTWPVSLLLDRDLANWNAWSLRLRLLCKQFCLLDWLDPNFIVPDASVDARGHRVYSLTDQSLSAFIFRHISELDYKAVCDLPSSCAVYAELRRRHEKLGSHTQILLIEKVMKLEFCPGTRFAQTWNEIDTLVERIKAIGPLDYDQLKTAIVIKALGRNYENLQLTIQSITKQPAFSVKDVSDRLLEEDDHVRNREAQGFLPVASAFASQTNAPKARTRPTCSHCKRTGHYADFCVQPGGKMAGRSVEDARAAYRASQRRDRPENSILSTSANVAATSSSSPAVVAAPPATVAAPSVAPVMINGIAYAPVSTLSTAPTTDTALFTATGGNVTPLDATYDFLASIAVCGAPQVSIDWDVHSKSVDLNQVPSVPVAFSASRAPILDLADSPFFLDTGANAHISPEQSDFKTLRPISPHPITGIGGSCIHAIGIGSIDVTISSGHKVTLEDVLFAPASKVRLVSVLSLNRSGRYTSHFDEDSFWLTNRGGTTILRGTVHENRRLYALSLVKARTTHKLPSGSHSISGTNDGSTTALYATRTPDVETWHRRLGHCNFGAIVDMARKGAVEGMAINLSSSPPKCDACIRGKQTRSPVSKVREGEKASRPLERVFVDLCGPINPVSSSGRLYSMNVIDDFSSYVWCLPLKSKGEAASVLQNWHRLVENQSGHRLKILVTDNGELVSNAMADYCARSGIDHRRTAPYTSAQNGRAERLHRTLLDKARAMLLSCKAPAEFWDEFSRTSAYLTNLTPSSSLQGRTPFELWFGRRPSLSHLREIGCRAFALIQTSNPKVFARSRPCVLIGYSPHSKAYRLWDVTSGRIFDSFHVSFVEHLDEHPAKLLPGTTITLEPDSPPSWETALAPRTPHPQQPHYDIPTHPIPTLLPIRIPLPSPVPPVVPNHPSPPNTPHIQPSPTIQQNQTSPTIPNGQSSPTIHIPNDLLPIPSTNSPSTVENIPLNPTSPISPDVPDSPVIPPITIPPISSIPHPVPLRRSSRTRFSSSRAATNDGLLPDSRLSSALSDLAASSARTRAARSSRLASIQDANEANMSAFIDDLPTDDHTHAFLSEFSEFRHTHDLLPLDLPLNFDGPIDVFLSDIETGLLEPIVDTGDDPSWTEAIASPEREYWIAGAQEELRSLNDLQVFVLVPRSDVPRGKRLLKGKLVCKRKRDDSGEIIRYKVRYVAKGYAQQPGIDFTKTTAPTARLESFRSILHLAATLGWDIQHFDIKTAFLHGVLGDDEVTFMEQPSGFEEPGKETWVMRLMKSIYGMRQASRRWNQTFHKAVEEWGFSRVPCEWCVYIRRSPTGTVIFAVHVDDIFSIAWPPEENSRFRDELKSKWEISDLGPAKFALGIAISRDGHSISLSQTAFIDRVLDRFGQTDAHSADTPMVAGLHLRRPDKSAPTPPEIAEWAARTPYRELIGSLNYIAVATRPDIAYAVGRLASFLDCYRTEHWSAAIRVLRYLKGTRTLSLVLGSDTPPNLLGYSDADYANCKDTSRSISGHCFSLGSGMISWSSRKQRLVADSTCYAEYIALHDASHEAIFLRQLLDALDFPCRGGTTIHCDNDASLRLAEDHVFHSQVKHIRVKFHSIRNCIDRGELKVLRVRSADNTADILTKPLGRSDFLRLRCYLGLR